MMHVVDYTGPESSLYILYEDGESSVIKLIYSLSINHKKSRSCLNIYKDNKIKEILEIPHIIKVNKFDIEKSIDNFLKMSILYNNE